MVDSSAILWQSIETVINIESKLELNLVLISFRTCKGHKRLPLSSDYPDLCPTLEMLPNAAEYCNRNNRWRTERLNNKTIAKAIESEIHNYARENLAIINIFIKESYTKRFRKTEKMSRISYIASSGGLLGLCMGFSFVSLAEIAYHCFLCIVLLFRKKRALFKKTQAQKKRKKMSPFNGSNRHLDTTGKLFFMRPGPF